MLAVENIRSVISNKTLLAIDSLHIRQGEHIGIVGPNGAGKSTLLKAIVGDMPTTGSVMFQGKDINQWDVNERARHLGVLPQSGYLPFDLSAREVVETGLIPLTISKQEANTLIEEKMSLTDSIEFINRPYPLLSGGEKQRVQLARVLVQISQAIRPSLLILDEPISAQDIAQQVKILNLTKALCDEAGVTVLIVLHDINHVLATCHRCIVINKGKLVDIGKPYEVLTPKRIEETWGYRPEELTTSTGRPVLI